MRQLYLILFLLSGSLTTFSQDIQFSFEVQDEIEVCGLSGNFEVTITNNTASTLSGVNVEVDLPDGIFYVSASVDDLISSGVSEADISDLNVPLFSSSDIAVGDSINFQIEYQAKMPSIAYQQAGNIFRNAVKLLHTGGEEETLSESYNILYPSLNVVELTPFSQEVLSGDTTSRSFKIINAGNGKTDLVKITDVFTAGASLLSVDIGTIVGDTIVLSGSDFSGIGNGDDYFDSNEFIVVTETIYAYSCEDVTSSSIVKAYWGCNGESEMTTDAYAHVSVDFQSPSLKIESEDSLNYCFASGGLSGQELRLINTGSGIADVIELMIYKSTGGGYDQSIFSRFEMGTFVYKIGASGAESEISPSETFATNNSGTYSCLGGDAIGKVSFDLPALSPGDTLFLNWDMMSCGINSCDNDKIKGWKADLTYKDVCGITNYSSSHVGQNENSQQMSFFTETPAEIDAGETENFTYIVSSHTISQFPETESSAYEIIFELEEGLAYESLNFLSNGIYWFPTSVSYNETENTVNALFAGEEPFVIAKSELELNLVGVCGVSGWKEVNLNVNYILDTNCVEGSKIPLVCDVNTQAYLHCPGGVCTGLAFSSFVTSRTSFGLPDNDLNGIADGSGTLNLDQIKLNRAMVGDTIQTITKGFISGAVFADYGQYEATNDYGVNLINVGTELKIYDASEGEYYTLNLASPTTSTSGNSQTFIYSLSVSNLAAIDPTLSTYQYNDGDSLNLTALYKIISSVSGNIKETTWTNEFYVSEVADPTEAEKMGCTERSARITLIGYSWRNDTANNYTVKSCTRKISQNFGMSIGDCCSNYGGGNLFPYEYRSWGYLKEVKVTIPDDYELVNTKIRQSRTQKTNSVVNQTINGISPDDQIGNTLIYDVEQYYGAGLNFSDDGFNGFVQLELAPSCDVPQDIYQAVVWEFIYTKTVAIDGQDTEIIEGPNDQLKYQPSNLKITSPAPWIDVNQKEVSWTVQLKNNSSSSTDYSWIHIVSPENITIEGVKKGGTSLTLSEDIYLIGEIGANSTKTLTIEGVVTNCDSTTIQVYVGSECVGYPANFASYSCDLDQISLHVEPKISAFQVQLFSNSIDDDPCSALVEVGLEISSVKIAHMYDMQIQLDVSDTSKMKVVNSSSYFQYNLSNSYELIDEPTFADNQYDYIIDDYEPSFELGGIPGALDLDNNRYRWKTVLELGEQFVQGDYLSLTVGGGNACEVALSNVILAYDPNSKFEKDNTAGLHLDIGDSWTASWGDYDNDGYDDLFVPNKDVNEPNLLYHNNGDGTLSKVLTGPIVEDLGGSISGSWGDYDNDGDLDLFVVNNEASKNKLYRNNGDETFTSVEGDPIVDNGTYSHASAWGDYDNDGDLDLVVTDLNPSHYNFLYRNNGDGSFSVVEESIISQSATSAVGASWVDYDNDNDLDLFVANTNGQNNQLFINQSGTFELASDLNIVTDGGNSIGGVWGDYDNDGDLDLYVTNASDVEPNYFYENNNDGTFEKILSGVVVSNMSNSHGASWIDYDNDGDLDLVVANDQNKSNYLFANQGDKSFVKMTNALTEEQTNSYGLAWSDYDNDGDYDVLFTNHGENSNDFFVNEKGTCNNYISIKLNGCNSNFGAIGARIHVKAEVKGEDVWQMREISSQSNGLGGQNSAQIIIGLGSADIIDSLIIRWPSGLVQTLTMQAVNQTLTINEDCGAQICGTVFHDENLNGIQDDGESGIPYRELIVSPGGFNIFTNANGEYKFYAENGEYTISQLDDGNWSQFNPIGDITVSVDTDAEMTYCGNDFANSPDCLYGDLELSIGATAFRRGLPNDFKVTVTNVGAFSVTDEFQIELKFTDNVYLVSNDWDSMNEADGFRTYSYSIDSLGPFEHVILNLVDSVALSTELGDPLSVEGTLINPGDECSEENNQLSFTDIVVGSIDPNDKLVFVDDKGILSTATINDTIVYKIRFQNLGNYAARRVVIVDTLSPDLDWESLQNSTSSHDFSFSKQGNILYWVAENIELPDSASDPEGSMGYVSFTVRSKRQIAPYTTINNVASIQFDYNEHIVTNTAKIQIVPFGNENNSNLFVYPNPTESDFNVCLLGDDGELQKLEELILFDANGNQLKQLQFSPIDRVTVDVTNLSPGLYIAEGVDSSKEKYRAKIIVR